MLKKLTQGVLKRFGKRITNFHAPAKPFSGGMQFLKEIIDTPQWIIDVGAANGTPEIQDAYPMSEHKYLLIDAAPTFYTYLQDCKKRFPNTVEIEQCFCGAEEGSTVFNINRTGHYSSQYIDSHDGKTLTVPVQTLDSLTNKYGIQGPLLLKIDVEGAELDVLKGAKKTLQATDVAIIETWINHYQKTAGDFAEIVWFMKQQGFVVFDFFSGHANKRGLTRQVDTVFVKEESPYRLLS